MISNVLSLKCTISWKIRLVFLFPLVLQLQCGNQKLWFNHVIALQMSMIKILINYSFCFQNHFASSQINLFIISVKNVTFKKCNFILLGIYSFDMSSSTICHVKPISIFLLQIFKSSCKQFSKKRANVSQISSLSHKIFQLFSCCIWNHFEGFKLLENIISTKYCTAMNMWWNVGQKTIQKVFLKQLKIHQHRNGSSLG